MFNFGRSDQIRYDGFYYSEPYREHFGEVDLLRFYRDGSCIKHWTQSNDINVGLQYIDVRAAKHGKDTMSGWAGTFKVNQGEIYINLQSNNGQEIYEGVILSNGGLRTNWQLTSIHSSYPMTRYQFHFAFRPHRFWNR